MFDEKKSLKLHEDAIRSRKKTDDDAASSDQPAEDEEPHTEPADEAEEAGKGKGLIKSKLKGLKGTKKRGVLSMSPKSGDMDESTSYASKARTEMGAVLSPEKECTRVLQGFRVREHPDTSFE